VTDWSTYGQPKSRSVTGQEDLCHGSRTTSCSKKERRCKYNSASLHESLKRLFSHRSLGDSNAHAGAHSVARNASSLTVQRSESIIQNCGTIGQYVYWVDKTSFNLLLKDELSASKDGSAGTDSCSGS
jgi:hypothetical protein